MSFFSTFSDINRNGAKFKQQEQQNADEQAKRDKYFEQHKPSTKDQKEADEFRRVVIDAVNLMDTESENKAESTELFFEQTNGMLSMGVLAGSMFLLSNNLKKAYDTLNKLNKDNTPQKEGTILFEDNTKLGKILQEKTPEKVYKELRNHKMVFGEQKKCFTDQGRLLNTQKWEKLSDDAQKFLKNNIPKELTDANKKIKGIQKKLFIVPIAASFVATSLFRILGTKLQIESSRIARFQARDQLKDPMNFVEYTDEQKSKAKEVAEMINVADDDRNAMSSLKDIKSLLKDKKAYDAESKKLDNVHLKDIKEKDVEKAYGRQKVLNRAIRKINNDAENYSEDIETSASVLVGSSFLGGALFGKLADLITKPTEKKLQQEMEEATLKGKQAIKKGLPAEDLIKIIKKNKSAAGGVLATLIASPFVMRLQKDAARAGRFQAKRDLENDPNSFLDVPKEELDKVNAKGKVKKNGIFSAIKTLPQSLKIMRTYSKYKKTELKEEKAMSEALKRSKISDKQLEDAQALQMRVFKSFDTIDDYSQEYSEDMEAACEIGEEAVGTIGSLSLFAIPALIVAKPHKAMKTATGLLGGIFKASKKFSTKYADGIAENWTTRAIKKITKDHDYKKIKPLEKDINAYAKEADETKAAQMLKELKVKMNNSDKIYSSEIDSYEKRLTNLRNDYKVAQATKKSTESIPLEASKKIKNAFKSELEAINEPAKLKEEFNHIAHQMGLDNANFKNVSDKSVLKTKENIIKIIDNVPDDILHKIKKAKDELLINEPAKAMIKKKNDIKLSNKELFLTKELKPIAYAVGGTFVAGVLGITYGIQGWLTNMQKKAGRLGVESAISELNQENENFKTQNKNNAETFKSNEPQKTLSYFNLVKAKRA